MSNIEITVGHISDMNYKLQQLLETNKRMLDIISNNGQINKTNLLTANEAAAMLGISYQYFMSTYRKSHDIPEVRKGKQLFYNLQDILDTKKQLQ
jgi:hypothetical protein